MSIPRSTPIIVGIGEICQKSVDINSPVEPADLILAAIRRAVEDAQLNDADIIRQIDSISIVPPWSWSYEHLPILVAEKLGRTISQLHMGVHAGNQPALLIDNAARCVSLGETKVAVVAGGEALATLAACRKAGAMPPAGWTKPASEAGTLDVGDLSVFGQNVGTLHGMGLPIQVYPMYENGFRKHQGQTVAENMQESARLYAAFDEIACKKEFSWRFGQVPRNTQAIGTITSKNRMICTPYPLLMNAFNTVNLAAACILTSVEHAEQLGIPEEKWVYVLGGAGTADTTNFWERSNYYTSPALAQSLDATLESSGLSKDEVDCFDFYSCFPIVPKLACKHLGLNLEHPGKPITLLGGLTSFGGAGNNYSMHAITEMTRQLRKGTFRNGLILANGGVLTYQHALCLSSRPRQDCLEYPRCPPLPNQLAGVDSPPFMKQVEGLATIETYTVEFNRDGTPRVGHIVGRLRDNEHRFLANHGDDLTLRVLANPKLEPIGVQGMVKKGKDGRNLFYISVCNKL